MLLTASGSALLIRMQSLQYKRMDIKSWSSLAHFQSAFIDIDQLFHLVTVAGVHFAESNDLAHNLDVKTLYPPSIYVIFKRKTWHKEPLQ